MLAAVPAAHQPWGAKGVQLSPAREGSATAIATTITPRSTDESPSWNPEETRRPSVFASSTITNIASPTEAATADPEPERSAT